MPTYRAKGVAEFRKMLGANDRAMRKRVRKAIRNTARDAIAVIRSNMPIAFGDLAKSAHVAPGEGNRSADRYAFATIIDAPHAAAVEVGSRPHWIPLEPLIAWVKLRGMQGLSSPKKLAKLRGTTTKRHALSVAGQIQRMESGLPGYGSVPVNAPEQVARAIQAAIAKKGTKPHWYVRKSLPEIRRILDNWITVAMTSEM